MADSSVTHQSVKRVKESSHCTHVLYLIVSISCVLVGLGLVVLFTAMYVVPHMSRKSALTHCSVYDIRVSRLREDQDLAQKSTRVNNTNGSSINNTVTSASLISMASTLDLLGKNNGTSRYQSVKIKYTTPFSPIYSSSSSSSAFYSSQQSLLNTKNGTSYLNNTKNNSIVNDSLSDNYAINSQTVAVMFIISRKRRSVAKSSEKILDSTDVNSSGTLEESNSRSGGKLCIEISVVYNSTGGARQRGLLFHPSDHTIYFSHLPSGMAYVQSKCFCQSCGVDIRTDSYQDADLSKLNFSGASVAAVRVGNQMIRRGETIRCASPSSSQSNLRISLQNLTLNPEETDVDVVVLLNAMIWPTLLFIAGFVSLFFACIQLAQDRVIKDERQNGLRTLYSVVGLIPRSVSIDV